MDEKKEHLDGRGNDSMSHRAFVLIVVFVLVMSAISVGLLYIIYEPTEPEPPSQFIPTNDPFDITDDTVWSGMDEILPRPVHIHRGGSLEIVDSTIEVLLEDMVLGGFMAWKGPHEWFRVRSDGGLLIQNSTISLSVDPRFEGSVVATGMSSRSNPSSLSRAVNLKGTEDPVLSMDILWRYQGNRVKVAVQEWPQKMPEVIEVISPDKGENRTWVHYDVPLGRYVGLKPRVIIFPDAAFDLVIGDLLVTDGGEELPGDIQFEGAPFMDGWLVRGFDPFLEVVRNPNLFGALIEATGPVSIIDSTITAPPNLQRVRTNDFEIWKNELYKNSWRARGRDNPLSASSQGGHINMMGSDLTVIDSDIENVPIALREVALSITDSRVQGDGDLLTLYNCTGRIEGTELVTTPLGLPPTQRSAGYTVEHRYHWGVSVSSTDAGDRLVIDGCSFIGSEVAVDIDRAWVTIDDTTFEGISLLAIWDHEGEGLGSWSEINGSNTFIDCDGHHFYRSHDCRLLKTGDWRTGEVWNSMTSGDIVEEDRKDLPPIPVFEQDTEYVYLHMPEVSVDANGTARVYENLTMTLETDWGGPTDVTVETSVRIGSVNIPYVYAHSGEAPNWTDLLDDGLYHEAGVMDGSVLLKVWVQTWNVYMTTIELSVEVDGEPWETLPLVEDEDYQPFFDEEWMYRLNHTIELDTGETTIDAVLRGSSNESDEVVEIWNRSIRYYRVTNGTDPQAVKDFLSNGTSVLVLDAGVEISIDGLEVQDVPLYRDSQIEAILYQGSTLVISGVQAADDSIFGLVALGRGLVEIRDCDVDEFLIYAHNSSVEVENITSDFCELISSERASMNVSRMSSGYLFIYLDYESSLRLDRVTLVPDEFGMYVLDASTLTITNCTINSKDAGYLYALVDEGSTFEIVGSSFENFTLSTYSWDDDSVYTFSVRDCVFRGGEPAVQFIDVRYNSPLAGLPAFQLLNNTFIGQGADVIVGPEFVTADISGNDFLGDARLLIAFDPMFDLSGDANAHVSDLLTGDDIVTLLYDEERSYRNELLFDITTNRSKLDNPGSCWVVIRMSTESYGSYYIGDFVYIDLSESVVKIFPLQWEDVDPWVSFLMDSPQGIDENGSGSWWEQ